MDVSILPHMHLIGQIAKVTERGVLLAKEYEDILKIGLADSTRKIYEYCYAQGKNEISLMFINERPVKVGGVIFYCLKEIGHNVHGDWHYYSLNQLMICNE